MIKTTPTTRGSRLPGALIMAIAMSGLIYISIVQDFDEYPEGLSFVFPGMLFVGALALGLRLLIVPDGVTKSQRPESVDVGKFLRVAILSWAFAIATGVVGFVVSCPVFVAAVLYFVFMRGGLIWLVVTPLIITTAFTLLFGYALKVPLPRGVGPFYALSGWII